MLSYCILLQLSSNERGIDGTTMKEKGRGWLRLKMIELDYDGNFLCVIITSGYMKRSSDHVFENNKYTKLKVVSFPVQSVSMLSYFFLSRRCWHGGRGQHFWHFQLRPPRLLRGGARPDRDWRRQSSHQHGEETRKEQGHRWPHSQIRSLWRTLSVLLSRVTCWQLCFL